MGRDEVAVVAIVFSVIAVIGYPLARALARRIEGARQSESAPSPDVTNRLDRIEHAVEAIAVEVERISEGQRFVTKLMSGRSATPANVEPVQPPALPR